MWSRSIALTCVTAVALLVGCSADSGTDPQPAPSAPASSASAPAGSASPAPSTPTPTAASPSTSRSAPTSDTVGTEITTADGTVTFTLPCGKPEEQEIELNERDREDLVEANGWRCGRPPNTTAAVIVAEVRKAPESEDEARRGLQAAAEQLGRGGSPKQGTFQGRPGITNEVTQNGRSFAYQGVSVDTYLVLFLAPADQLSALTDTVTISS